MYIFWIMLDLVTRCCNRTNLFSLWISIRHCCICWLIGNMPTVFHNFILSLLLHYFNNPLPSWKNWAGASYLVFSCLSQLFRSNNSHFQISIRCCRMCWPIGHMPCVFHNSILIVCSYMISRISICHGWIFLP